MGKSRTALVTGASRGLGAAIAETLAQDGHRVAVNYFANAARAEKLCSDLRSQGLQSAAFAGDVRDEGDVALLISQIEAKFGPVEVLVVNATGPQPMLSIEEQTWQSYLDLMEFFVKSPLLLAKQVVPQMKQTGFGRIIQIGSEVVETANARFANYIAAKAAQLGQTRSWARELAPHGITVNLVAPGWIPTERHANVDPADMAAYAAAVPMRRMGVPLEVARTVAFLASDDAGFITGQKISVNGGLTVE